MKYEEIMEIRQPKRWMEYPRKFSELMFRKYDYKKEQNKEISEIKITEILDEYQVKENRKMITKRIKKILVSGKE